MGIPFGDSPLLSLVTQTYFRWDSCWNFPVGASELIPFVARSDRFCYSRSVEIPSRGFLLVFSRWGFTLIFFLQGTQFFPQGVYCSFPFLGNSIDFAKLNQDKANIFFASTLEIIKFFFAVTLPWWFWRDIEFSIWRRHLVLELFLSFSWGS